MTRPQIVRADTIDLQDQLSPSAKDHSRQPTHPAPLGAGRPAPHQEQAIRHAEHESKVEMMHGPESVRIHLHADDDADAIDIYDDMGSADDGRSQHEIRSRQYGNAGVSSEEEDLADADSDELLEDDMMDKISSSPSIDDEDIDFEFVYALHNFIATVEGQANAAKGDTMVLLDDSNSYWWLVRVVKDGSIGYLPAEHIETPTERLARLNKHRNIDLSATMLGDNSEKSKNPLKKAMRRRNAKTVTFTAPTYIEASDVEYSTDEEDTRDGDFFHDDDETDAANDQDDGDNQSENIVVEPLRPKPLREKAMEEREITERAEDEETGNSTPRTSEEIGESRGEPHVSRSRNGTVRNTDSFFKDDTVETKKISLTPNLLRDEVSSSSLVETREAGGSFDILDRNLGSSEKGKDDKKKKDKKSGMLSGLFKRKDKKSKNADDELDEFERTISPQPKSSMESLSHEPRLAKSAGSQKPSGKLQKQHPGEASPTKTDAMHGSPALSPVNSNDSMASAARARGDHSIRQVVSQEASSHFSDSPVSQHSSDARDTMSPPNVHPASMKSSSSATSGSQGTSTPSTQPPRSEAGSRTQPSAVSPPQTLVPTTNAGPRDIDSESPVDVSPVDGSPATVVPGLMTDTASQDGQSVSPVSPPMSPADDLGRAETNVSEPEPTKTAEPPAWSDASLRAYLEDETEMRDLFIIVHDKSNVPPAGPDHPISGSLFKEESRRLKEMSSQLDEMLLEWIGRRIRQRWE